MRSKISELAPTRDVPLALICATAWILVLWLVNYPADESVGVAIVAYAALWTSRMIVNALPLFALRRLHSLALRKADEFGVAIPEEPSPAIATTARAVAVVFLLAMLAAIVGMSIIATVPIVALIGLPPLAAGFGVFGWMALVAGASVLAIIFGVPFILLRWPERIAAGMWRLATGIGAVSDIIGARPLKALALVVNPRVG